MNLFPYVHEEKYRELKDEKEKLEGELNKFKNKFEAESERRSKLATRKQELDERVNELEQKLQTIKDSKDENSGYSRKIETNWMSVESFENVFKTLESLKSPKNTITSIYLTDSLPQNLRDTLNQTLESNVVDFFVDVGPVVSFRADHALEVNFRINPKLYSSKISTGTEPDIEPIKKYIGSEKTILRLEAGKAQLFKAQNLEVETVWEHQARINDQHSKGGFSQSRFENLRQEAVEEFISEVSEKLPDSGNTYGLGNRKMIKNMNLEYLGGYDDNLGVIQNFYKPQNVSVKIE